MRVLVATGELAPAISYCWAHPEVYLFMAVPRPLPPSPAPCLALALPLPLAFPCSARACTEWSGCVRVRRQAFAVVGCIGENFVMTLLKRFGALIAVITTSSRKFLTMVASFVLFPKPFTLAYGAGMVCAALAQALAAPLPPCPPAPYSLL
jgi:hypothetical protein